MGQVIGIDLGTTNTVVHYKNKKGKIAPLRYNNKEDVIPSVVYFLSEADCIIGQQAARRYENNQEAGAASFKSHLGDSIFKYEITAENGDKFILRPHIVARRFLETLLHGIEGRVQREFEDTIDQAVITVPAKFNPKKKELIRKAAMAAGFPGVKLAKEPTAAAIACQDDDNSLNTVLVYDFGGGTFDVSLIQRVKGKFEEITTDGIYDLGGNNLTASLAMSIMEDIDHEKGINIPYDKDELDEDEMSESDYLSNRKAIIYEADIAKQNLSDDMTTDVSLSLRLGEGSDMFEVEYRRKDFEKLIRKDIMKTVEMTKNVIERGKERGVESIDAIVLAGGSSNIPLIKKMIRENIPGYNIMDGENYSHLISKGAAILAQDIANIDEMTVPITNSRMGISITEGMTYNKFKCLIPEGVALPYTGTEICSLNDDDQTKLMISYYEHDILNYPNAIRVDEDGIEEVDNLIINLPPGLKKDEVRINISFTAERDGSMNIAAEVVDLQGKAIVTDKISVSKGSDLE